MGKVRVGEVENTSRELLKCVQLLNLQTSSYASPSSAEKRAATENRSNMRAMSVSDPLPGTQFPFTFCKLKVAPLVHSFSWVQMIALTMSKRVKAGTEQRGPAKTLSWVFSSRI